MLARILLAVSLISSAAAFSTGAPDGACTTRTPLHGVSAQTSVCPYDFVALGWIPGEYTSMGIFPTETGSSLEFKGFLASVFYNGEAIGQMRRGRSADNIPTSAGVQTACDRTSLTHSNNGPKQEIFFEWKAPLDLRETAEVTLRLTIVETRTRFWIDCGLVQLGSLAANPVSTTTFPTTSSTSSTTTAAPRRTPPTTTQRPRTPPTTTRRPRTRPPTSTSTFTSSTTTSTTSSTLSPTQAITTRRSRPATTSRPIRTRPPTTTRPRRTRPPTTSRPIRTRPPTTTRRTRPPTTARPIRTRPPTTSRPIRTRPPTTTRRTRPPTTSRPIRTRPPTTSRPIRTRPPTTTRRTRPPTTSRPIRTRPTTTSRRPDPQPTNQGADSYLNYPHGGSLKHETMSGKECIEYGNVYRIVPNTQCRQFTQSIYNGRENPNPIKCPGSTKFDPRVCSCAFTTYCTEP